MYGAVVDRPGRSQLGAFVEHDGPGIERGIPEPEGAVGFASPAGHGPAQPLYPAQPQPYPAYPASPATPQFHEQAIQDRIPFGQPPQLPPPVPAAPPAQAPSPQPPKIGPMRAFREIGLVYFVSFGLGVVSAVGLLTNPSLSSDQVVHGWLDAGSEIMQYIMQAAVVILGVGYFSLKRGITLSSIFGRSSRPAAPAPLAMPVWPAYQQPYPQQYPPGAYAGYPPPYGASQIYGYVPYARQPTERGRGWQFARAFFVSIAGVLAFLVSVIVYVAITKQHTSAPDQGNSLWLIPVGAVVALAAGLGEEVLITGMVTTTLEQAGFARRAWVIYLVAIALRVPFHLYYGWASLGVVCFTVVNIWVYRRWRLLWPIVLAHAAYDAIEFAGSLVPQAAGLGLILLGLVTFVMLIVIACVELSDLSARRRLNNQWRTAPGPGY